jgi:hypothetical protein
MSTTPTKIPRGRPAYAPTKASRSDVTLMVADGFSEEQVAAVLGIDPKTLTKYFANEILNGRAEKRFHYLKLLEKQAKKGSSSSTKALLARSDIVPDRAPRPAKLGKKEMAKADAVGPSGTSWDDLLPGDQKPLLQ